MDLRYRVDRPLWWQRPIFEIDGEFVQGGLASCITGMAMVAAMLWSQDSQDYGFLGLKGTDSVFIALGVLIAFGFAMPTLGSTFMVVVGSLKGLLVGYLVARICSSFNLEDQTGLSFLSFLLIIALWFPFTALLKDAGIFFGSVSLPASYVVTVGFLTILMTFPQGVADFPEHWETIDSIALMTLSCSLIALAGRLVLFPLFDGNQVYRREAEAMAATASLLEKLMSVLDPMSLAHVKSDAHAITENSARQVYAIRDGAVKAIERAGHHLESAIRYEPWWGPEFYEVHLRLIQQLKTLSQYLQIAVLVSGKVLERNENFKPTAAGRTTILETTAEPVSKALPETSKAFMVRACVSAQRHTNGLVGRLSGNYDVQGAISPPEEVASFVENFIDPAFKTAIGSYTDDLSAAIAAVRGQLRAASYRDITAEPSADFISMVNERTRMKLDNYYFFSAIRKYMIELQSTEESVNACFAARPGIFEGIANIFSWAVNKVKRFFLFRIFSREDWLDFLPYWDGLLASRERRLNMIHFPIIMLFAVLISGAWFLLEEDRSSSPSSIENAGSFYKYNGIYYSLLVAVNTATLEHQFSISHSTFYSVLCIVLGGCYGFLINRSITNNPGWTFVAALPLFLVGSYQRTRHQRLVVVVNLLASFLFTCLFLATKPAATASDFWLYWVVILCAALHPMVFSAVFFRSRLTARRMRKLLAESLDSVGEVLELAMPYFGKRIVKLQKFLETAPVLSSSSLSSSTLNMAYISGRHASRRSLTQLDPAAVEDSGQCSAMQLSSLSMSKLAMHDYLWNECSLDLLAFVNVKNHGRNQAYADLVKRIHSLVRYGGMLATLVDTQRLGAGGQRRDSTWADSPSHRQSIMGSSTFAPLSSSLPPSSLSGSTTYLGSQYRSQDPRSSPPLAALEHKLELLASDIKACLALVSEYLQRKQGLNLSCRCNIRIPHINFRICRCNFDFQLFIKNCLAACDRRRAPVTRQREQEAEEDVEYGTRRGERGRGRGDSPPQEEDGSNTPQSVEYAADPYGRTENRRRHSCQQLVSRTEKLRESWYRVTEEIARQDLWRLVPLAMRMGNTSSPSGNADAGDVEGSSGIALSHQLARFAVIYCCVQQSVDSLVGLPKLLEDTRVY